MSQDKPTPEQARLDRVYRDRNLLAIAFAVGVYSEGGRAGWYHDPNDSYSEWPIVWVQPSPGGDPDLQMGWHVHPNLKPLLGQSLLPNKPCEFDGHTRGERNNRLVDGVIVP